MQTDPSSADLSTALKPIGEDTEPRYWNETENENQLPPIVNTEHLVSSLLFSMSSCTNKFGKPFLIGVAGGTGSGKSEVCEKIMRQLSHDNQRRVALIKQESFYRVLNEDQKALAIKGDYNFDHPDAIDEQLMYRNLKSISEGKSVSLPKHDYRDNSPKDGEFYDIESADVVLFVGVLAFYFPLVREMFHLKLFLELDSDNRLSRRIVRDVRERGRPLERVLHQYDQFVKPAFEEFCQPTKKYADVIIPRGPENELTNLLELIDSKNATNMAAAIELIVQYVSDLLS